MQHFSEEFRQKLINEHRLVSASIARLGEIEYAKYARAHGYDAAALALTNLKARKVELEVQIDVLTDFLHG